MKLLLNNTSDRYEIEQLSRMFFRNLEVEQISHRDRTQKDNFIYVRHNKSRYYIYTACNGKKEGTFFTADENSDIKTDMQLCIAAYDIFVRLTGNKLPWGVLTGVRPVRLYRNLYKKYENIQAVKSEFREVYRVTEPKIQLCDDIFNLQKPILEDIKPKDFSLYIGIPFCPSRCSYCSFVSTAIEKTGHLMPEFVDKLCVEIEYIAHLAKENGLNLKTIYMGGGTPTSVSAAQLEKIMASVQKGFNLSKVLEYTVEAGRPDCTTAEKLRIIKQYGADRVSINPQTFNDTVLKAIGRSHSVEDFYKCVEDARKVGFKSINMDLIAGLPEDTVDSFAHSLQSCIDLGAENITVHTLTLKRASNLVINPQEHNYDDVVEMIAKNDILYTYGYRPYYMYRQKSTVNNLENVGFSQIGHESLYNIYIMEEVHSIISAGGGGVSKVVSPQRDIKRVYNYKYPGEYISNFDSVLSRKDEYITICKQFGIL